MALYVADTHGLMWHASGQRRKLGHAARSAFQAADAKRATIYVPTTVLVEVLEGVSRGVFRLGTSPTEWMRELFRCGGYICADLTLEVIEASARLGSIRERGDRLIAATALSLDLPLITREPIIVASEVSTLW